MYPICSTPTVMNKLVDLTPGCLAFYSQKTPFSSLIWIRSSLWKSFKNIHCHPFIQWCSPLARGRIQFLRHCLPLVARAGCTQSCLSICGSAWAFCSHSGKPDWPRSSLLSMVENFFISTPQESPWSAWPFQRDREVLQLASSSTPSDASWIHVNSSTVFIFN